MYFSLFYLVNIAFSQCTVSRTAGLQQADCANHKYAISIPAFCVTSSCGLIVDTHGAGGGAEIINALTGIREKGNAVNFIVANPYREGQMTWDDLDASAAQIETDIRDIVGQLDVNEDSIHATGFSQGGYITWALLCRASDLFASVAPLAASGHDLWAGWFNGYAVQTCFANGGPENPRSVMYHSGVFDPFFVSPYINFDPQVRRVRDWQAGSGVALNTKGHWNKNGHFSPSLGHCVPNPKQHGLLDSGLSVFDYSAYSGQACKVGSDNYDWGQSVVNFFMGNPKSGGISSIIDVAPEPLPDVEPDSDTTLCWEGKSLTLGQGVVFQGSDGACEFQCMIDPSCFGWIRGLDESCSLRRSDSPHSLNDVESFLIDSSAAAKTCIYLDRVTGTEVIQHSRTIQSQESDSNPNEDGPVASDEPVKTDDDNDEDFFQVISIVLLVCMGLLLLTACFFGYQWCVLKRKIEAATQLNSKDPEDSEFQINVDQLQLGEPGVSFPSTSMCKQATPMLEDEWDGHVGHNV